MVGLLLRNLNEYGYWQQEAQNDWLQGYCRI
jgi:hypothetical protein